jgi:hypothetical protein
MTSFHTAPGTRRRRTLLFGGAIGSAALFANLAAGAADAASAAPAGHWGSDMRTVSAGTLAHMTVPSWATIAEVIAVGGPGASIHTSNCDVEGGLGTRVTASFPVTGGESWRVYAGGGGVGSQGGWSADREANGAGSEGGDSASGGGGGGATGIERNDFAFTPILVAAGGGGAGNCNQPWNTDGGNGGANSDGNGGSGQSGASAGSGGVMGKQFVGAGENGNGGGGGGGGLKGGEAGRNGQSTGIQSGGHGGGGSGSSRAPANATSSTITVYNDGQPNARVLITFRGIIDD